MQAAVSLRGFLPSLAAVAAATVLSTALPETALAAPTEEPVPPRTTSVDRTEGLDPRGDTVTVTGTGHDPGSRIEITTRAVPAEAAPAADPGATAVLDDENAVLVEVDEHGRFGTDLSLAAAFAAEAGLDSAEDVFEIVLTEVAGAPTPEATVPETPEPSAPGSPESGDDTGPDARDGETTEVVSAPGPGRSAPVTAPARPRSAPVVGVVPVSFAAPAAPAAPRAQPQAPASVPAPAAPRPQSAPQTLPRTPGAPTLTVSRTSGLDPSGERVTVTGTGYDTAKGVYVALCDTANASSTQAPSPCIGGVDMEGEGGASVWVSSNPPPYGEGLATPYTGSGTDGGFTVELTVKGSDEHTDCLSAATDCAVVTRNDHTRSSDRGQDVFVPVTFSGQTGDPGATGGNGGNGGASGDGATGSGNTGGTATSGSGGAGSGGASGGGAGPLATTGSSLAGLVLTAAVAVLAGAVALFAARRRGSTPTPLPTTT